VDVTDWLLALHLLAAFALMAALVLFTAVLVAGWAVDRPRRAAALSRVGRLGTPIVGAGAGLALVFGIVLAIDIDGYEVWDVWILVSIALWVLGGACGGRVGAHYEEARKLAEPLAERGDEPSADLAAQFSDRRIAALHAITVAAFTLILVLMIFKPGA
jgi:uncharacterized membrane protein